MGFWQSVNGILQNVSGNSVVTKPQSMEEVILQTAESHLAHESKIEALKKLNDVDDWAALQKDDREKVKQYEMAKLPWRKDVGSGDDDEMGHILGDVTIQQAPNRNPVSSVAVPLATLGVLGLLAWKALDNKEPAETQPATQAETQPVSTDTVSVGFDDTYNDVVPGFGQPKRVSPDRPSGDTESGD